MKIKGTHVLLAYPFVLVASFYSTWLFARMYLGHWPRPHVDDPKFIEGFWMWTYDLMLILFVVGLPVACLCTAVSLFRRLMANSPDWRIRMVETIIGLSLLVLAWVFLRWDPANIFEWFLD